VTRSDSAPAIPASTRAGVIGKRSIRAPTASKTALATRASIIGPSPKRLGHGPTRRIGERRTRAKTHHKIRAPTRQADQARQFRPQTSDFDGLIHESALETEQGRLQRKTLGGATSQEPVLMVCVSETKTAMPADDAIWRAYLSFSSRALNARSKNVGPSQAGRIGLPVVALNRPSPRRIASRGLNRIQLRSSRTKASSDICVLLPVMTRSRTRSIFGRSVIRIRSTPGTAAAEASVRRSALLAGLPS
jgi:hypothetical protein